MNWKTKNGIGMTEQENKKIKSTSVFLLGCCFSPVFSGCLAILMLQAHSQEIAPDPPKSKSECELINICCEHFKTIADINITDGVQPLDNCWHRLEQRFRGRIRLIAELWALWWHIFRFPFCKKFPEFAIDTENYCGRRPWRFVVHVVGAPTSSKGLCSMRRQLLARQSAPRGGALSPNWGGVWIWRENLQMMTCSAHAVAPNSNSWKWGTESL